MQGSGMLKRESALLCYLLEQRFESLHALHTSPVIKASLGQGIFLPRFGPVGEPLCHAPSVTITAP